ncbi:MAG: hypothetical protein CL912_28360 [Deltaproteobacteria bacterium]|nr:hypothetical protein [Deltaproteobacteria bacterium]
MSSPTSGAGRALDLKPCLRGLETLGFESLDCRDLVALRRDFEGIFSYVGEEQALLGLKQVASKFSINSKSPKSELPGLVRARP